MNCFLSARVSTEQQADKDLSIPAQLHAMRNYARERGWNVVEEFVDAGASGRNTDRPALHRLLAKCRSQLNDVEAVIVHKIDRLARNVADHAMIRVLLKRAGIRLASVVENLDDSVSGQLVEHMMAAVAEFHSANLSEETKKGMRQMVMQGGWPHLPPRGYAIDRDGVRSRIVIHPHEGPLMAEAFDLYATGWWSIKRLALHLASKGLVSKSGGPMPHSHLQRLLGNPFYAGRIEWKDLRVPGTHPPLVSPELWDRAQTVRGRRRKTLPFRSGLPSLPLRIIGRCSACGGGITIDRRARLQYYRCSRRAYQNGLCRERRFCRVHHAHEGLERICRSILFDDVRSLWDLCSAMKDPERMVFLEQVSEAVTLSPEGIVDFKLKPLWIQAVVRVSHLLNAA